MAVALCIIPGLLAACGTSDAVTMQLELFRTEA
jgi:hypothetical protein